jgi:meiotic recombination protein SPO11
MSFLCNRIEILLGKLLDTIYNRQDPCLILDSNTTLITRDDKSENVDNRNARQLLSTLKVMRSIYELKQLNLTCTSREIYYMHAEFFRDQKESDLAIKRITNLLAVSRHELGILASSKGQYCGPLFTKKSPTNDLITPISIPGEALTEDLEMRTANATFILVVEKDSIFQRLVEDRFHVQHNCIMITGRGFPDLATRAFLKQIYVSTQGTIPIFGLSDYNPFGMAIMLCYREGSITRDETKAYKVPLLWVGMRYSDLINFELPRASLQPNTETDEAKLRSLENDSRLQSEPAWLKEIEFFKSHHSKMELEGILTKGISFFSSVYLPTKLHHQDWI